MKKNKILLVIIFIIILILIFLLLNSKKMVSKINISAYLPNGSLIQKIEIDKKDNLSDLVPVEIEGYNFLYWTVDDKIIDSSYKIGENSVIKAVYEKINTEKYIVTFDTDGGSLIESVEVNSNSVVNKPNDPTKEGYTFVEWQLDDKTYSFDIPITSNITLKAIWKNNSDKETEIIKYTVVFDTNGGSKIANVTVENGTKIVQPINPTKKGYTFVEWQLNNKTFSFNTPIISDITLKAVWKSNSDIESETTKYTITFNTDGGNTISSKTVVSGSKVEKPSNPTKSGYTFVEWQLNDKTFSFNTPITSNITLKAVWKKNNESQDPIKYTVIFDTDGGSTISSKTVVSGNKVERPSDPTKNGYTFVEWQLDNVAYSFDKAVTSNITLKAKWKKNEVQKTYKFSYRPNEDMFANGPQVVTIYDENNTVVDVASISIEGYMVYPTSSKIIINYYDIDGITTIDIYLKDGSGPFRATKK